ncbi:MAG: fatty acid--CoA ligase family protein, partial [Helicobacter sp.]|nr:fatty acid--CoA ligase family protein [Helicobacter sp.]
MADFLEQISPFKENIAIICDDKSCTYATLLQEIQNKKQSLNTIPQGSVVALMGDYSFEQIAYFFALYSKQCILAPMLPRNMDFDVSEFGIEFILQTHNGVIKPVNSQKQALIQSLKDSKQSGLILFSSGSTGKPKAIVHNLDTFIAIYCGKKYNPLRILSVYLPDHIAGIDVMLNTLGGGGTLVIPKQRQPHSILDTLKQHKVEILPASPTLLRLLLLSGINTYDLEALKLVVYGSESMSETLLKSLQQALPHTRFKQGFGTSETNAIKTKSHPSKKGFFEILNTSYKIINNELYLKSKTQALGYLNADNSVFDEQGYFATGDLVENIKTNGEEYLKVIGRAKEIINVGGEKVMPQEVENILLEMPNIQDCLVYGEKNAITGQSVSVKVIVDSKISLSNLELKKQIRSFLKDKLAAFKIPAKVEIVETLAI